MGLGSSYGENGQAELAQFPVNLDFILVPISTRQPLCMSQSYLPRAWNLHDQREAFQFTL
jgi:hypothetical protein